MDGAHGPFSAHSGHIPPVSRIPLDFLTFNIHFLLPRHLSNVALRQNTVSHFSPLPIFPKQAAHRHRHRIAASLASPTMPPKRKFADIEPEPPAVPPSLPPSVEEAYRRKCVQLKNRTNEVEDANDAARLRLARIKRQVEKLRIERAFLLEQLSKRTSTNVEDSEGSPSPPPTVSSLCRCSFFLLASPSRWNHRYLRANGLGDRQYNHLRVSSNEYLTPLLTRPFSPRISHYVSNAATENPPFSTSTPKALPIAPSKNPHLLQNPKPEIGRAHV